MSTFPLRELKISHTCMHASCYLALMWQFDARLVAKKAQTSVGKWLESADVRRRHLVSQ